MRQNEWQTFKEILLTKKNAILEHNVQHKKNMEQIGNFSGDEADYATMSMENILESSIFQKHYQELEYIEIALRKIENGLYGICEMCEEEIDHKRLKAKPYAKYCIICREIVEKSQK
ncbi:MAG: RNA polymerase-binding protein DksA [Helicobacter sp.]|nr:RNA polymerase-binding protein DksA [Helicobacter sp.]